MEEFRDLVKRGLVCCIIGKCDTCPYHSHELECSTHLALDALLCIKEIDKKGVDQHGIK